MALEPKTRLNQSEAVPQNRLALLSQWVDRWSRSIYLLPAILLVLFLSIVPLIISLLLSLSRIQFVRGGFQINFVGFANYEKLLFGSTQRQFLGRFTEPDLLTQIVFLLAAGTMIYLLIRHVTANGFKLLPVFFRALAILIAAALIWLCLLTLTGNGLPGTLVVTLIFVFAGVTLQYVIGLGLALLLVQNLPGRRFFRVIYLMPMMITPVGIGFLFRMIADTLQGPIAPLWKILGLADFSWTATAFGARAAVIIGDTWQWTPFMFIILLAALEGVPREPIEAALVDGASRWQLFRYIILPQLIPVSTTVILIRLIESFKIIDMPQVLTYGGPGTATESVTLQAYNAWRALDLGSSAAMAYILLFVVTFVALVFVNIIRKSLIARI